jgi:hypothetical protein
LFGAILNKIAHKALHKVMQMYDEYYQIREGKRPFPEACTAVTRVTFGLSCIHIIKACIDRQQSLTLDHFHKHWHLYLPREKPPPDPRTIILEHRVVENGLGRPSGSTHQSRGLARLRATEKYTFSPEQGR